MSARETVEVRVRGTVQGVGFRPTVWRLAHENGLVGEVKNDAEGVLIRISGHKASVNKFLTSLPAEAPILAKIDTMQVSSLDANWDYKTFQISQSGSRGSNTEVAADAATCSQCREEFFNLDEPRYLYPFTNCTHCGPRLSIVKGIPYDRDNTTMSSFPMCEHCKGEYENPADRRFHAQPIACHACGPSISLKPFAGDEVAGSTTQMRKIASISDDRLRTEAILDLVNDYLKAGKIVAIRGIGGFHLSCDATNNSAVARLRQRKHRYAKPFALMTPDVDSIERYCHISAIEKEQLLSPQAPIVLLTSKQSAQKGLVTGDGCLSEQIAFGTHLLGFMLPYTPLHWLITEKFGKPLVMTSGNLSDEPQIIDNPEACEKLADIADLILFHNREIANRIDDSVIRCMAGQPRLMRRARGYAPRSIPLPEGFENCPDLLAFGAELKSTFCLLKDGMAIVSQHQGDLEDLATFDDYEKNLLLYKELYEHTPQVLVADKHPEYLSSKLALKQASDNNVQLMQVQHHHAHIASCLAENLVPLKQSRVLGVALDGLGFGDDGSIWGGEFLLADYCSYRRVGRFKPVAMIGGTKAILEPWRNTYAHILSIMSWSDFSEQFGSSDIFRYLETKPIPILAQMLQENLNSPLASSCGRLFDGVAAAIGICRDRAQFEGQGAMELEMLVEPELLDSTMPDFPYAFDIQEESGHDNAKENESLFTLDPRRMWLSLFEDIVNKTERSVIASRFHAGLISGIVSLVKLLSQQYSITTVALSGGCMQNRFLLEGVKQKLENEGLNCLCHSQMPSNDGGISLGQASIAAARLLEKTQDRNVKQQ